MKKENLSKIAFITGVIVEIILFVYVELFKVGTGISFPIYIEICIFLFPQIIGSIGIYFSRYTKQCAMWLILNAGLIFSCFPLAYLVL